MDKRELSDINFEIGKPCWQFDWMFQSSSRRKWRTVWKLNIL